MRTNIVKWTHRIIDFENAFIFNWIGMSGSFSAFYLQKCNRIVVWVILKHWNDVILIHMRTNDPHTILKVKQAKNHSEIMSMTNWFLRVGSLLLLNTNTFSCLALVLSFFLDNFFFFTNQHFSVGHWALRSNNVVKWIRRYSTKSNKSILK